MVTLALDKVCSRFARGSCSYTCVHIYTCMAVKTISIRDDVYKMLSNAKHEEESFSDVIERLLKKDRVNITKYFGALKDSPLLDGLEEDSRKIREMAKERLRS